MRSKAHFKTHPLHPMLVGFPIAFFTGTLIFHVLGWVIDHPAFATTAYYLNGAGIVFALLAAIPGFIDYLKVVPPQSSGKSRAARHGILNVLMLLLFTAAFIYRRSVEPNDYALVMIELVGVSLMSVAGWMGGTLVYRNMIGVDIRYANAGKWNEAYFDSDTGQVEVAQEEELKVNAMKLLHLKKKRIVLARTENGYAAFDDRCPHRGGSLAGGSIMCGTVQCPWHGSQFSVQSGAVTAGPAKEGIGRYGVEVREGKVFLSL